MMTKAIVAKAFVRISGQDMAPEFRRIGTLKKTCHSSHRIKRIIFWPILVGIHEFPVRRGNFVGLISPDSKRQTTYKCAASTWSETGMIGHARRIDAVGRIIANVPVMITVDLRAYRVLAQEPTGSGIEVSGTVLVQAGFSVEFAARVAETVRQRACGGRQVAEGVVSIGICEDSRSVAQRGQRTQPVCLIVSGRAAA